MSLTDPSPRETAEQRALTVIGLDVLRTGIGGKMTTSLQLQEQLDVGSGTIQKATRHIVNAGAARLRVRGYQGTIVEDMDPSLVWRAAGLPPIRVVLPPPGAIESTSIGLGIRQQLAQQQIAVEFDFVRGARRRLDRLDSSSEQPIAALLSRGAAEAMGILATGEFAALDFGAESYYDRQSLVRLEARDEPRGPLRVAKDTESHDHSLLTDLEFGSDVTHVACPFMEVPAAILEGRADAGIWHRVVTSISPEQAGLRVMPLKNLPDIGPGGFANAVLVWPAERREIDTLLGTLDLSKIAARRNALVGLGANSAEVRDLVPWL